MEEELCLTWDNYITHMMNGFRHLLVNQSMIDVTLSCDGMSLKAHKIVLSACSPLFQTLFLENPCQHPIVILTDVKYADMKVLLDIIYFGKVNIPESQLFSLKQTAENLKMRGIVEGKADQLGELSQQSVIRPDGPSPKRKKCRSRKSSLNDQSDGRASQSGNPDSDVEEVYSSKIPLEVYANETFPPAVENLSVVPLEETLQNNISIQEDQSSVQSIMKQQRQTQTSNDHATRSISVTNNSNNANQQPGCSAVNVPEQDDLLSTLKKAVETLQMKGLLPTTNGNVQSADSESADKQSSGSIPDVEIVPDSDIEEIIPNEEPQQEQTVQLDDDDEPILTDVVLPSCSDSSQLRLERQSTNLAPPPPITFTNGSSFNNQHIEYSSETSKGKRCTENENNQSADGLINRAVSQDGPPLKRRKRRRHRLSKKNRSTGDCHSIVLQQDSDIEVISMEETSSSFSTASTATLNITSSCQSQQQHMDVQDVDVVFAPKDNTGLEPNKISGKTLTPDDVPSHSNESSGHESVWQQTAPNASSFVQVRPTLLSSPDVNYEHPESTSGQLVAQDQLSPVVETSQKEQAEASSEINGQNDDGVCQSRKSDSAESSSEIDSQNDDGVCKSRKSDSSAEGQLVAQEQLSPSVETAQKELAEASSEIDGQNDDGVYESKKSDSAEGSSEIDSQNDDDVCESGKSDSSAEVLGPCNSH